MRASERKEGAAKRQRFAVVELRGAVVDLGAGPAIGVVAAGLGAAAAADRALVGEPVAAGSRLLGASGAGVVEVAEARAALGGAGGFSGPVAQRSVASRSRASVAAATVLAVRVAFVRVEAAIARLTPLARLAAIAKRAAAASRFLRPG